MEAALKQMVEEYRDDVRANRGPSALAGSDPDNDDVVRKYLMYSFHAYY